MIEHALILKIMHDVLIGVMENGRWELGIGDPTLMGWTTAFGYILASILCLWTARAAGSLPRKIKYRFIVFWLAIAGIMLALGINKQLDLQMLFTQVGRAYAKQGGWYEQRRPIQLAFILAIAGGGIGLLAAFTWLTRGAIRKHFLALFGVVFTGCFVVIRAASLHNVGTFLYAPRMAGLKLNWVLELGGILCIIVSAGRAIWRLRKMDKSVVADVNPRARQLSKNLRYSTVTNKDLLRRIVFDGREGADEDANDATAGSSQSSARKRSWCRWKRK